MSSSTRCDAVSVSSQLDTHIAEVLAGVTLGVNAVMPEILHDLHGLIRICAATSQAYVERIFSACGCSILDDEELCSGVSR